MAVKAVVCKDLFKDCCGITVQCASQQAVDLYNQGLLEYIKGYGDYFSTFEKALEVDPNFVLVRCVLVCIFVETFIITIMQFVGLLKSVRQATK